MSVRDSPIQRSQILCVAARIPATRHRSRDAKPARRMARLNYFSADRPFPRLGPELFLIGRIFGIKMADGLQ